MKRQSLSKFETMAQRLVEGSFKRLFGERLAGHEVAVRLARAMEDSLVDGRFADSFTVYLHPADLEALLVQNQNLTEELTDYLVQLAQQGAGTLTSRPPVAFVADPALRRHQIRALAEHNNQSEEQITQIYARSTVEADILAALRALDAYLIVEGRTHVPLNQPLLTLGRRTDNDVVLDSATVSRQHAQIRWRYGRFILYDLSRRGRTMVNDQPVTQHALQPGDVIALSNTPIIYGEGREEVERPRPADGDDEGLTLQLPKSTK